MTSNPVTQFSCLLSAWADMFSRILPNK